MQLLTFAKQKNKTVDIFKLNDFAKWQSYVNIIVLEHFIYFLFVYLTTIVEFSKRFINLNNSYSNTRVGYTYVYISYIRTCVQF